MDLNHGQRLRWTAFNLYPVDEAVWRRVDVVANAIAANGDAALLQLKHDQTDALSKVAWPIYREHWSNTRTVRFGVPQPSKYSVEQGEGVLYGSWTGHHGDGGMPLACTVQAKLCKPFPGRAGYEIFYFAVPTMQLEFNSQMLDLRETPGLYDRKTNKVYLIGTDEL